MSVLPGEKDSLEDFRRWKVLQLEEFLGNRGLKTTGSKGELAALAFGARPFPILLVKCWKVVTGMPKSRYLNFKSCHLNFFLYKR